MFLDYRKILLKTENDIFGLCRRQVSSSKKGKEINIKIAQNLSNLSKYCPTVLTESPQISSILNWNRNVHQDQQNVLNVNYEMESDKSDSLYMF